MIYWITGFIFIFWNMIGDCFTIAFMIAKKCKDESVLPWEIDHNYIVNEVKKRAFDAENKERD
tara:strand:+ start:31298 stop:31486 length:189 start_codon:yes stop_codon:yes gene_type:complete